MAHEYAYAVAVPIFICVGALLAFIAWWMLHELIRGKWHEFEDLALQTIDNVFYKLMDRIFGTPVEIIHDRDEAEEGEGI